MATKSPVDQVPTVLSHLRLPIFCAPMFLVSYPRLVLAQCRSGVIGSFPVLNARPPELLRDWLQELQESLLIPLPDATWPVAPFAVNLNVNDANTRLEQDMRTCLDARVPIFVTSLRAPPRELVSAAHAYGGMVFHDVVSLRHAEKALHAGVDGLILVAAGAGGHGGTLSPFALLNEVRAIFDGPLVLSGAIATGGDVFAARAMGADLAYVGSRFIATEESDAPQAYKQAVVASSADDIVYSDYFSGVKANYLRHSIEAAGLDPYAIGGTRAPAGYVGPATGAEAAKRWKDIWAAGHGVGSIRDVPPVAALIDRMHVEYLRASDRMAAESLPAFRHSHSQTS